MATALPIPEFAPVTSAFWPASGWFCLIVLLRYGVQRFVAQLRGALQARLGVTDWRRRIRGRWTRTALPTNSKGGIMNTPAGTQTHVAPVNAADFARSAAVETIGINVLRYALVLIF